MKIIKNTLTLFILVFLCFSLFGVFSPEKVYAQNEKRECINQPGCGKSKPPKPKPPIKIPEINIPRIFKPKPNKGKPHTPPPTFPTPEKPEEETPRYQLIDIDFDYGDGTIEHLELVPENSRNLENLQFWLNELNEGKRTLEEHLSPQGAPIKNQLIQKPVPGSGGSGGSSTNAPDGGPVSTAPFMPHGAPGGAGSGLGLGAWGGGGGGGGGGGTLGNQCPPGLVGVPPKCFALGGEPDQPTEGYVSLAPPYPAVNRFTLDGFEPEQEYEFIVSSTRYDELGDNLLNLPTTNIVTKFYTANADGEIELEFTPYSVGGFPFPNSPKAYQYRKSGEPWSPTYYFTLPFPGIELFNVILDWPKYLGASSYKVDVVNNYNDYYAFEAHVDKYPHTALGLQMTPGPHVVSIYPQDADGEVITYEEVIGPSNINHFFYNTNDPNFSEPVFMDRPYKYWLPYEQWKYKDENLFIPHYGQGVGVNETIAGYRIQFAAGSTKFPDTTPFVDGAQYNTSGGMIQSTSVFEFFEPFDELGSNEVFPGVPCLTTGPAGIGSSGAGMGSYACNIGSFGSNNTPIVKDYRGYVGYNFASNPQIKNYLDQRGDGLTPIWFRIQALKNTAGEPAVKTLPVASGGVLPVYGEVLDFAPVSLTWNRLQGAENYVVDIVSDPARFNHFNKLPFETLTFDAETQSKITEKKQSAVITESTFTLTPGPATGLQILPKNGVGPEPEENIGFIADGFKLPHGPFYFRQTVKDEPFNALKIATENFAEHLTSDEARVSRAYMLSVSDPKRKFFVPSINYYYDEAPDVINYWDLVAYEASLYANQSIESLENYVNPRLTSSETIGLVVKTEKEDSTLGENQLRVTTNRAVDWSDHSIGGAKIQFSQISSDKKSAVMTLSGTTGTFLIKLKADPFDAYFSDPDISASSKRWTYYIYMPAVQNLTGKMYFNPSFLAAGQKYYWRVIAYNPGSGAHSVSWSNIEEINANIPQDYYDSISDYIYNLETKPTLFNVVKDKVVDIYGSFIKTIKKFAGVAQEIEPEKEEDDGTFTPNYMNY